MDEGLPQRDVLFIISKTRPLKKKKEKKLWPNAPVRFCKICKLSNCSCLANMLNRASPWQCECSHLTIFQQNEKTVVLSHHQHTVSLDFSLVYGWKKQQAASICFLSSTCRILVSPFLASSRFQEVTLSKYQERKYTSLMFTSVVIPP